MVVFAFLARSHTSFASGAFLFCLYDPKRIGSSRVGRNIVTRWRLKHSCIVEERASNENMLQIARLKPDLKRFCGKTKTKRKNERCVMLGSGKLEYSKTSRTIGCSWPTYTRHQASILGRYPERFVLACLGSQRSQHT